MDEIWGHEGYLKWLIDLRISYTRRRNALLAACEDYLPADIALWVPLASGMFLGSLIFTLMLERGIDCCNSYG